jgi:hypothetical protein
MGILSSKMGSWSLISNNYYMIYCCENCFKERESKIAEGILRKLLRQPITPTACGLYKNYSLAASLVVMIIIYSVCAFTHTHTHTHT